MGIGFRELLIILVIVLLVFGTKKLPKIMEDLGSGMKGFKKAMSDSDAEESVRQIKQEAADAEFHDTKPRDKSNDRNA